MSEFLSLMVPRTSFVDENTATPSRPQAEVHRSWWLRFRSSERVPFVRLRRLLRHDWVSGGLLVFLDALVWLEIYCSAIYLRGDAFYTGPLLTIFIGSLQLAVIVGALFVIGGYSRVTEMRGLPYTTEHVLAIGAAAAISSLIVYSAATFDQTMKPSRAALLVSFAGFLPISLLYRRVFRSFAAASTASRAFLVVGGGPLAAAFYRTYKTSVNRERLEFVAIDPAGTGLHIDGPGTPTVEGDLDTKLERLDQNYSGVIVAERIDRLQPELLERLIRTQFQKTRVYTLESFHEAHWRYVPLHSLDPFWPLQTGFQLARSSPFHYLKKLFDVVLSSLLILLTLPLVALAILLIWMESGSPTIFHQIRVGRNNEAFTAFKFRTMFTGKGGEDADIYTRRDDPRVTRVGRWLRKLRLDELPQLWNVLKGEMSLIGPRAEWIKCAERYEKSIPYYHFRHLVKPGITGWAQVNYPYGESDKDALEKLKYDLYYIRNYSLKLDLMIVLKTIYTVMFGKGQ